MIDTQKSFEPNEKGTLYLVPTPIGNLEDMTFRAVKILKEVNLIASEDTRNTQKLLNHFEIDTPQTSYHEHNAQEKIGQLISKLNEGHSIAQVSDAGMPSISDPGVELVQAAIHENLSVVPLPGPNAAITALIASGLTPQPFYFYGFLPRKKKDLIQSLEKLAVREESMIFYESPHRLKAVLEQMENVFGVERKIVLAREITKRFEEFVRGTAQEVFEWSQESTIRGEFCIIVEGNDDVQDDKEIEWVDWSLKEHVNKLMEEKESTSKEAIKEVAKIRNIPKRDVYSEYHNIK